MKKKKFFFTRVPEGAVLCVESWHLCTLYHLSYGINSKSTQMQRNIMPKMIAATLKWYVYYYDSIFIIKFAQITCPLLMFISWSLNR